MTANINEAVQKIKQVGVSNTRVVPMPGQSVVDGLHQVEIREGSAWRAVVTGVTKPMAESIVSQASNRVILG